MPARYRNRRSAKMKPPSLQSAAQPVLLDQFRDVIRRDGAAAARTLATQLAANAATHDELYYVPFEHMNAGARLVIVGITPGPNQIALSYEAAQAGMRSGIDDASILARAKQIGSFGGPQMRPNLIKMLRAFDFARLLGIDDPADLWGRSVGLLHATSVVPHAAFRKGRPFSGSFEEVLASSVMRESFERDFAATLSVISPEAFYVALGPTPLAALDWCASHGLLRHAQVLGALAHPSSSGGSQVSVYLGEKTIENLDPRDPVRGRVGWLIDEAARMRRSLTTIERGEKFVSEDVARPPMKAARRKMLAAGIATDPQPAPIPARPDHMGLHFIKSRGANIGTVLRPHVQEGSYIVSMSRFEADYIRLPLDKPLEPWLARGFKLRMSAPGHAPSLIAAASILGRAIAE